MLEHLADKNIALDLVRVTEAAALSAARLIGKGEPESVNRAAVDAMRIAFQGLHIQGTVVVSEGDKHNYPKLNAGETLGFGDGPEVDVAIDPVDGTSCVATGRHNAISAVGLAERGTMFNPGRSFYCNKIIVGKEAASVIDIEAPVRDNLNKIARALGKPVSEVTVFVLDRPRNERVIRDIRLAGARLLIHNEGDIAGAILAVDPLTTVDVVLGVGGTAESVVTACAIKGSGGQMQIKFAPQSESELHNLQEDGTDMNAVLSCDDLIRTENCFFSATGITEDRKSVV